MKFPSQRTMKPPRVGGPPPPRKVPVVGGDRPPPPTKMRPANPWAAEAFEAGRCFCVFGPGGAGVSTLLRTIHEETETPTFLVNEKCALPVVAGQVEAARHGLERVHADVILVDGLPRTPADVQWLFDERLVAPGWAGAIIRVERNAVVDRTFVAALPAIENMIRALSMPYFVVRNDDPERAVVDLLCRMGIGR